MVTHYRQCLFCTCSSCFIGRSPIVSEVCLKGVQKFYPFYCLYSQFRMRTSQNLRRTWANPIESYYVTEKPLFYCLYMVVEEWLFCFQEILKLSRHQPKRPLLCYGYHRYIYKSWAYNIVFIWPEGHTNTIFSFRFLAFQIFFAPLNNNAMIIFRDSLASKVVYRTIRST